MHRTTQILDTLKKNGHRLTQVRRALVDFFARATEPVSVPDILSAFGKRKLEANKTTVYREIDFLIAEKIITDVHVDQSRAMYELASREHHHHVVCDTCSAVEDIDAASLETAIRLLEQSVKRKTRFADVRHSLEFFGQCLPCRRKVSVSS